jgi:hypothetical protein
LLTMNMVCDCVHVAEMAASAFQNQSEPMTLTLGKSDRC